MLEDNPAPSATSSPNPASATNRRVTRAAAFRCANEPTPRHVKRARRRIKEAWNVNNTPDLHWDNYQTFASESSNGSVETHQIVLSPNRTTHTPVFSPGPETQGTDTPFSYSPGTPLSNLTLDRTLHTQPRRATFSGLRTVSTSDIHNIVSQILYPEGRDRSTTFTLNVSGLYSELERDLIERPAPQACIELQREDDTMISLQDKVRAHRVLVREAVAAYREYDNFDVHGLPEDFLKETSQVCKAYKKTLLESCALLEDSDNTYLPPLSTNAENATAGYARTIFNCQRRIFELEAEKQDLVARQADRARETATADAAAAAARQIPLPASPTVAQRFKARKVEEYETDTIANLTALYGEFMNLVHSRPTTEKETKKAEERLSTLTKRAETAVKEGRSLAQDAAEADKLPSAEILEKEVRKVNNAKDEAISSLSEIKVGLGVIGAGANLRSEDLQPPVFSGDLEQLDYFTWATDLDDYFQTKNLSNAQQVAVVKKSCLKGVPATACLEMTSLDEILRFLKSYYGNAGLMLDAKIRDFRKLGKCPTGSQKKRDWLIRSKQKLETLHTLALKHNIQNHLYYSSLMSEIMSSLNYDAQKGFREQCDTMNVSVFDKEDLFKHTLEYLGELEQKANFQLNFEITMGASKSEEKQPSKPSTSGGKKTYNLRQRVMSDSEVEICSSEDEAVPTPVHIRANYSDPKERQCTACKKKHEYLFYCEKFQATRVKERFRITRAARVCMRCLRMDSRVDFNDREAWFKDHEKDCQTEWQCIAAECGKKEKDKQFHFLMCNRHISINKERVGAFEKKLDKAQLKPTTKFLYNVPRFYNIEDMAAPAISRHPEGSDIVDDITSPAIFLMQNYTTKEGKELPIMFDSGCSAAAISEKAHDCLDTQVLRAGPTEMGVAGGKTILIKGGDERFWLDSTTPGQLFSITGLCMPEITTPFPVYPLMAAFEELQTNYKKDHPQGRTLPLVPKQIGGSSVAIMMGIRYVRYFPKLLYHLNCGLGIYEAQFKTPDGNLGVLGGPHKSWTDVYKSSQLMTPVIFFTQEMKAYRQECATLRHLIKDFQHWDGPFDFQHRDNPNDFGRGTTVEENLDLAAIRHQEPVLSGPLTAETTVGRPAGTEVNTTSLPTADSLNEDYADGLLSLDTAVQLAEVNEYTDSLPSLATAVQLAKVDEYTDGLPSLSTEVQLAKVEEYTDGPCSPATTVELAEARSCPKVVQPVNESADSVNASKQKQYSFIQGDTDLCTNKHCKKHGEDGKWNVPAHWDVSSRLYTIKGDLERYLELENTGTELSYRCIKCRNCADCRKSECLEKTSLQEEKQQALLESCITLDVENKTLFATLPLIADPVENLKPNKAVAQRILDSQLRRLAKKPESIPDVLRAHNKLRDKGYVLPIKDLPLEAQKTMETSEWDGYYIPWSTVTKEQSLTSPLRQVYNASSRTPGGLSLNQVLAKGQNMLPKIFEILTSFRSKKHGFIGDISMAYNCIRLTPEFYCFQKYLWREGCDPNAELMEFVVITLIYGVICSGNMMQAGIEKVADHCIENHKEHADGARVVKKSVYVDDVAKATDSLDESKRLAKSVEFTLGLASMFVKDFTFVGESPSEKVSADGKSVGLLGYTWWPVEDELSISIKPLFFGKSKRGKNPGAVTGDVKEALKQTFDRRTLTGKAASVFDPQGLVTPVTARFKMNLSEIVSLRLGWDDPIPDKFLDIWTNNLDDMQRIKELRFPRSFIHPEAVSNKIRIITSSDASENIAVAAVHAVSELPDGSFHCRLIASKSKLVSLCTIPRAELRAAVLAATLTHVIKRVLGDQVEKTTFVTDSSVVLFWLHQDQRPLQTAVRNGVIEIRRLSNLEDWRHVASADNVADIGTRHVEVSDLIGDCPWTMGHPWMTWPERDMPLKTVDEVRMNQQEKQMARKEIKAVDICGIALQSLTGKLSERYSFSDYAVDPCLMSWPKSVRVLAFVKRFINQLKVKVAARRSCGRPSEPPTPRRSPRTKPTRVSAQHLEGNPENSTNLLDSELPTEIFDAASPTFFSDKMPAEIFSADFIPDETKGTNRRTPRKLLKPCLAGLIKDWQLGEAEIKESENYFFVKGTREVKQFSRQADYKNCTVLKDGILRYSSRVLDGQEIDDVENIMTDLSPLAFCNPVLDRWSPVSFAIMVYSHQKAARHRNAVATLRESRQIAFILQGRDLANQIRDACLFCRRFRAKLVEVEMGKVHPARLTIAPAFFRVQTDLFGPMTALCNHNHRANVSVWGCIFKDPASGAISVHAMEKYDTGAFLSAFARHSYRYGFPARMYIDAGSQLVKACREMDLCWSDLTSTLNSKYSVGVEHEICAVGRHDRHGMVERSVQDVKKLFVQVFKGVKMDLFAYETGFAFVANELNCLPICLGSKYEGLGHTDLITANRLLMGRNNRHAPLGYPRITSKSRQVEQLDNLHKAWWKIWKDEKIMDFIPSPPKWHFNSRPPMEGDIVVFLERDQDVTLGDTLWRLGRVTEIFESEGDRKIRSLKIEYKNASEETSRFTNRAARKVAILFREGELELTEILNDAARAGDQLFIRHMIRPGGPPTAATSGQPDL